MSNNQEICMEATHGRKSKCKTEFKAVINKVLVSGLVLATVLGTTAPAFAAEMPRTLSVNSNSISQEYGISVENAIQNIKNTIKAIEDMKANGTVSQSQIKNLASQLYSLDTAVMSSEDGVTSDVVAVLESAEKAIKGVKNANEAEVAIAIVKADLGIDSMTSVQYQAGNQLKSFKDVPTTFWAHDAIMDMVSRGMFAGTKAPDANGVGEFNPNGTMTRAQFITVITRYLYADKLAGMAKAEGDPWYANNYIVAVQEGLIKKSDFSMDAKVMNVGMSREEMAYVLVRAMEVMGESSGSTVSNSRIPDYNKIGTAYRSHVKIAYTKGLIVGTDAAGTFNPKGTLNRAQAATVIYRLIAPETRKPVDPNGGGITVSPDDGVNKGQVATGTTWVEGEKHDYTAVKAGATVVRADGTKVVLKETKVGNIYILGYGQGVDFVTGTVRNGNVRTADKLGGAWSGFNGNDLTAFKKDPISGEVHTEFEWDVISLETVPHRKGSYDGEKANTYFEWDSAIEEWLWTGP